MFSRVNCQYISRKLPVYWSSQVPRNWKKNAIVTSLHRAKRIASSLEIKEAFSKAAYPMRFINKIISEFIDPTLYRQETIFPTPWFASTTTNQSQLKFHSASVMKTKSKAIANFALFGEPAKFDLSLN